MIWKKKINLSGSFLQKFGLSGYAENKIGAFWFQKWPTNDPSYDNASLCYQRKKMWDIFQVMVREM